MSQPNPHPFKFATNWGGLEEVEDDTLYFDSEPKIAWRGWQLQERKTPRGLAPYALRSVTYGVAWKPGQAMRAHCIFKLRGKVVSENHNDAPDKKHTCGIYGVKEPIHAAKWAVDREGSYAVIGLATLWGKVLLHEKGYRAEFAYPKALAVVISEKKAPFPVDEAVHFLKDLWNVPVTPILREEIERLVPEDLI